MVQLGGCQEEPQGTPDSWLEQLSGLRAIHQDGEDRRGRGGVQGEDQAEMNEVLASGTKHKGVLKPPSNQDK